MRETHLKGVTAMKRALAILICVAFLLCAAFPALAAVKTEEVVYGLMDHDGSVKSVYVVNCFSGGGSIEDYGDYSEVRNMTTAEALSLNGDSVTASTSADRLYYQGTLKSKDLPWVFAIRYSLDGKEVSAGELAGRSGALAIDISVKQNPSVNPVFYENYMLQISLTLDTQKCENIRAGNATIASAGRNKVVAFTVLPGRNARFSVTADVRDFSMSSIEITGMPFSMPINLPDTGGLTGDLTRLSDAVDELKNGAASLSDGISQTYAGAKKLADGSESVAGGLKELSGSAEQMKSASAQIEAALSDIAASLNGQGAEGFSIAGIDELPGALRQLADGLKEVTAGMEALKTSYAAAYAALDGSIASIPDAEVDPAPLYAALSGDRALTGALDALMAYYAAAKTVKGTYAATKEAFAAVESSLAALSASVGTVSESLDQIADGMEQALSGNEAVAQLRQLKDGLTQLSSQYSQFHAGLAAYLNGVQALNNGYGKVHAGIQSLKGGMGQLNEGAKELASGTGELHEAVADLPDELQEEIDGMMQDYDRPDFAPLSFTSEKNASVSAVQFVLKTSPIEPPKPQQSVAAQPVRLTFWQKLLRLFGLYP